MKLDDALGNLLLPEITSDITTKNNKSSISPYDLQASNRFLRNAFRVEIVISEEEFNKMKPTRFKIKRLNIGEKIITKANHGKSNVSRSQSKAHATSKVSKEHSSAMKERSHKKGGHGNRDISHSNSIEKPRVFNKTRTKPSKNSAGSAFKKKTSTTLDSRLFTKPFQKFNSDKPPANSPIGKKLW